MISHLTPTAGSLMVFLPSLAGGLAIAVCAWNLRKTPVSWVDQEESFVNKVLEKLSLIAELTWTVILYWYYIYQSIWQLFFPPEPKDVKGDVILITGTGHGMGREVAQRFAKLGAKVVCVDINPKGNEETYQMIKSENGKAYKYECDVTDRSAVMQLAEKVRKEVGEVTILVNNAGIMPCKSLLQWSEKDVRLTTDINIHGNLWMIQAFLPTMMERNRGHIVAMSSLAGLIGSKNLVPYCGSKAAVRMIMDALATELRQDVRDFSGIKLTTICPYIVDTGLAKRPKIRFEKLLSPIRTDVAADQIVDAVLREYETVTIPATFHYTLKIHNLVTHKSNMVIHDFFGTICDPHE